MNKCFGWKFLFCGWPTSDERIDREGKIMCERVWKNAKMDKMSNKMGF